MKLDDVYKEWIHVKARQVKLSSLSTYQLIYLRKLAPAFGDMEIEQLNKKIIVPFLNDDGYGRIVREILQRHTYSFEDADSIC